MFKSIAIHCSSVLFQIKTHTQVNKLVLAHLAADRVPIASSGVRYYDIFGPSSMALTTL